MSTATAVYGRLPVPLQHAAVTAYGLWWRWLRLGPGYRDASAGFVERERWSAEQWASWQRDRVAEVLRDAAEHVPHYREAWDRAERRAALAGHLTGVPLLDKEPVRDDPRRFLDPRRRSRPGLVFHTSGSTGTPIATHWTVEELRTSMALREARSARWAGVSFSMPRATFSGRLAEPRTHRVTTPYRYNAAERQLYLSPFHLRPDTAVHYASALRRHRTEWATGYAASFGTLGRFCLAAGIAAPRLRAVITTSEPPTGAVRAAAGDAFGCRVYEEYSAVENCLFASECEHGSLHVSPECGYVEILTPDGSPAEPGEVGEVVATMLLRRYQPLVRFRLGDLAAWSPEPCRCGRALPVLEQVVGRLEDVVTGPDGREMVRFHRVFVDLPHVVEGQVVRHAPDRYTVRIVAVNGFGHAEVGEIRDRMRQQLGEVVVEVTVDEPLERGPGGKVRAVIDRAPDPTNPR